MRLEKAIGRPVGVGKHTQDREYGFFANVLIDINLPKPVSLKISVKEEEGK